MAAMMPAETRDRMLSYWGQVSACARARLAPLLAAPWSVQIHVASAWWGWSLGQAIFHCQGTGFHRLLGWTWVSAMILVAATSVAMIVDMRSGINALHIFTVVTVVSLWSGLTGIRRGNVRRHAASMVGLYIGGLIIAGITAFIPGRMMWSVVFGG
jgi:uncharacterized membrane protein